MLESLKKALQSVFGPGPWPADEVRATIERLIAEGKLSRETGEELRQALERLRRKEGEEVAGGLARDFQRLLELVPVVSRSEFRRLEARVQGLEARLGVSGDAPDEVPGREEPPSRSGGA